MDKIAALLHEAKIEADENRSKDTRYFAASVVECIESLSQQLAAAHEENKELIFSLQACRSNNRDLRNELAAALAACEAKDRGLDKLARLGNEPYLGNSIGNTIAAEFLSIKPDASILHQHDAELIERCACTCEEYQGSAETCAEAIRELKQTL